MQLTEEQFELCQHYLSMLDGIEEGFEYVLAGFTDYSKSEGDLVLSDILQALTSIAHTNTLLKQVLADNDSVQQAIKAFHDVTNAVFKLDGNLNEYVTKINILTDFLYPAFSIWKEMIENALNKYVSQ